MSGEENTENLTLRLLREMRADLRSMEDRLGARLDKIEKRLDAQTEALKGETLMARYTALRFDEQISSVERRLEALETKAR